MNVGSFPMLLGITQLVNPRGHEREEAHAR